jgi:uncharacterized OB-fold protein
MPSPRYWREIPTRYRLEGRRCRRCDNVIYPARRICPTCRGTELDPINLSHHGTIITSTVIEVAPTNFQMEAPYGVAVVETPEGARLMAQVVDGDLDAIGPGTKVDLEFRRIQKEGHGGILCYGYKAVPTAG